MQIYKHLTVNNIKLEEMPFPRELTMEAYLIENESVLSLGDENLSNVEIIDAELPLSEGRVSQNSDGRIDLLAKYDEDTLAVLELKLGELNHQHLSQLEDYLNQKEQIIEKCSTEMNTEKIQWLGILVGTGISSELEKEISEGKLVCGDIPIAAIVLRRYRGSDGNIFVTTNSYFKNTSRNFDKTKYLFNNGIYGKGRLVLAVIRSYLKQNSGISYQTLVDTFPKELQGGLAVFTSYDKANQIFNETGRKRHFLDLDDLLEVGEEKIAICSQWGVQNITKFINHCISLGIKIQEENKLVSA